MSPREFTGEEIATPNHQLGGIIQKLTLVDFY